MILQVFLNMALAGMAAACAVNKDAQLEDCSMPAAYIITPATDMKDAVTNGECSTAKSAHSERNGNLAFLAVGNGSHLSGAHLPDPFPKLCSGSCPSSLSLHL